MSLNTVLLCDLCVLLFGIYYVIGAAATPKPPVDDGQKGKCSCGGYPTTTPEPDAAPLLSQSPDIVIKCDDEGEATCKKLCTALALAAKAQGPELICNRLKNADELELSAFYKICDKPWTYMQNMTEAHPLCCEDSKVKVCASMMGKGNCTCGAFPTPAPEAEATPMLAQLTELVKCDDDGDAVCKKQCVAIAGDRKLAGPDALCGQLKNADELKLSAFYKTCEKPWTYIQNMTSPRPLCCENSKTKVCASAATSATTPVTLFKATATF